MPTLKVYWKLCRVHQINAHFQLTLYMNAAECEASFSSATCNCNQHRQHHRPSSSSNWRCCTQWRVRTKSSFLILRHWYMYLYLSLLFSSNIRYDSGSWKAFRFSNIIGRIFSHARTFKYLFFLLATRIELYVYNKTWSIYSLTKYVAK